MKTDLKIADIRKDYMLESLLEKDVNANPMQQFSVWWDEAIKSEIDEVNAMTLATVGSSGKPSARIVLLKGYTDEGLPLFPTVAKVMAFTSSISLLMASSHQTENCRIGFAFTSFSSNDSNL